MFLSAHESGVDARGRTSIPAQFREALPGETSVYLFPSLTQPCLEGGGSRLLKGYQRQMRKLRPNDPHRLAMEQMLFARVKACGFDVTGRAVLDADLRAHAGIGAKARFVGLGNHFQVWEPEAHERHLAVIRDMAVQGLDLLDPFDDEEDDGA